jgi:uncharacterized protein YkwD
MSLFRRSSLLVLTAALALSSLGVPAASASASGTTRELSTAAVADATAAEQLVVELINERRHRKGLRSLRVDSRLASIARARSEDMIDRGYFSHEDPDGKFASNFVERARIKYSRLSEIIAWNRGTDLLAEAEHAVAMWMDSSVHRHEILSTTHNYLGAGVATDGRTIKWTVISITGPDRTDPVARITSVELTGNSASVRWSGYDPRLAVGTAGLRDYDLARRHPGGSWATVRDDTTRTSTTWPAHSGTEFRVRARDKAGNVGPWSAPVTAAPTP